MLKKKSLWCVCKLPKNQNLCKIAVSHFSNSSEKIRALKATVNVISVLVYFPTIPFLPNNHHPPSPQSTLCLLLMHSLPLLLLLPSWVFCAKLLTSTEWEIEDFVFYVWWNKVCVNGVCFVFFNATDNSQRSCIQTVCANVKVKVPGSQGDLHLRVSVPFAWRYLLQKRCPEP